MSEDKEPDVAAAEEEESHRQEEKDIINAAATENGSGDDHNHDQLLQMIAELRLENDSLRSQFNGLKDEVVDHKSEALVKQLHDQVASLSREIDVEKQTRVAAEQALEHLREAYSEADAKAQEYSTKFSQGLPYLLLNEAVPTSHVYFLNLCHSSLF